MCTSNCNNQYQCRVRLMHTVSKQTIDLYIAKRAGLLAQQMLITDGPQKQARIKVENTVQDVTKSKENKTPKSVYSKQQSTQVLRQNGHSNHVFSPSVKREWSHSGANSHRKSKMTMKHLKLKAASKQPLRRNRARWSKKSDSFIIALKLQLFKVQVYERAEKYIILPMNLTFLF